MNMQEFLIPMTDTRVDIKENEIFELSPELLNALLKDHTLSTDTEQVNIFLATDNYADRGGGLSVRRPNQDRSHHRRQRQYHRAAGSQIARAATATSIGAREWRKLTASSMPNTISWPMKSPSSNP